MFHQELPGGSLIQQHPAPPALGQRAPGLSSYCRLCWRSSSTAQCLTQRWATLSFAKTFLRLTLRENQCLWISRADCSANICAASVFLLLLSTTWTNLLKSILTVRWDSSCGFETIRGNLKWYGCKPHFWVHSPASFSIACLADSVKLSMGNMTGHFCQHWPGIWLTREVVSALGANRRQTHGAGGSHLHRG